MGVWALVYIGMKMDALSRDFSVYDKIQNAKPGIIRSNPKSLNFDPTFNFSSYIYFHLPRSGTNCFLVSRRLMNLTPTLLTSICPF